MLISLKKSHAVVIHSRTYFGVGIGDQEVLVHDVIPRRLGRGRVGRRLQGDGGHST